MKDHEGVHPDPAAAEAANAPRVRRFRPLTLAASRMAGFWRDVWKSWRLVFDWTVVVYLALPAAFVFANMYRDAWDHPPGWFALMRPRTVYALLGLLMLRARLRTFADPGDGLFLRRSARWTGRLLAAGIAYTFAARLLLASAALALLIPVLTIRLHWTAGQGMHAALSAALLGFAWALARDRIERGTNGWRRIALLWLVRAVLMAAWVAVMTLFAQSSAARYAAIAAGFAASALLVWRRAKAKGTFLQEILAESEAYQACVRLLLKYSVGIRSKPKGRRPLLSFAGRKLFRGRDLPRRIAELGVKAGLRESGNMSTLLQLALAGAAALLLVPFWTGLVVWLALGALAQLWLHGQWRQWEEERYVSMLPWPPDALSKAEEAGRMAFFLPLFELWGAVLGAKAGLAYGGWGWLAVLALLALGRPLAGYVNGTATRILRRRRSRRRAATEGLGSYDAESARR